MFKFNVLIKETKNLFINYFLNYKSSFFNMFYKRKTRFKIGDFPAKTYPLKSLL